MATPSLHTPGNILKAPYAYVPAPLVDEDTYNNRSLQTHTTHVHTLPFAEDGNRPRWKPLTLKTPFLLFFFLVTVSLIVVIEILNQKSQKDKALIFIGSLDDLTTVGQFSYRYLLTVISVLYGMVWASVDLDIKRLEPFFQLSHAKGATAANSILLHYPFDFLATVPITALARRHYSVFSSGFALILIFWVITPMQAALLAISPVSRKIPTQFIPSMEFFPFDEQSTQSNAQYFYNAFGTIFLGEKMQPWLNESFIAMPFEPLEASSRVTENGMKESWTAVTRTYATSLNCTPGSSKRQPSAGSYNITKNGGGCSFGPHNPILSREPSRNIQYLGFGNYGGNADYYLQSLYCDDPHEFLVIWAETLEYDPQPGVSKNRSMEIVPIFCKPSYSYTDMNITVDSETFLVTSTSIGTPVPFTQDDKIIDLDRFEGDVSTGASEATKRFIETSAPTKPGIMDLIKPTRQISYSLGLSPEVNFEDLRDPKVLAKTFEKGQKFLFASFAHSLLRNITAESDTAPRSGYRTVNSLGVVVIQLFARLLEGFLAAVAICFAFLGIVTYRRHANLFSDPDSLASKMALVADSKPLLQNFDGLDESPELKNILLDRKYRLEKWESNGYYRIDLEDKLDNNTSAPNPATVGPTPAVISRPLVLRTSIGILLVVFLLGLLGFLLFLWDSAKKHDGLPTLSKNQIVVQIIFSVVPTVLATGLEPLWVLITRYFCVYQPYTELFKGNASPSTSLSTKYTNVPPALVLFRAFRTNHFVLFSLSATALLCNLLAVSLGGLFDNEPRPFNNPKNFTQSLSPQFNATLYWDRVNRVSTSSFASDDATYKTSALSNITQGTSLPAWVSKDYYFLPFEWDASENASDSHTATTRGFGMSLDCLPLDYEGFKTYYNYTEDLVFNITLPVDDGRTVVCARQDLSYLALNINGNAGEEIAGEYLLSMWPAGPGEIEDQALRETCRNAIVRGWTRAVHDGDRGYVPGSFKNVTTVCQQTLKTAMFEVEVDGGQKVLDYKISGAYDEPADFFPGDTTLRNFTAQIVNLIQQISDGTYNSYSNDKVYFHNGSSFFESWTSYLIDESPLSTNISDPSTPLPDFDSLAKALASLWSLEFALILGSNSGDAFLPESTPKSITGFTTSMVPRVLINKTMFYITAIILGLNAIVAAVAYICRPKNFLPRFPDTLASEIAYFYGSQALRDVSGTAAMGSSRRDRHLNRLGQRYGFGFFRGEDGKDHRGVERSSVLERYIGK